MSTYRITTQKGTEEAETAGNPSITTAVYQILHLFAIMHPKDVSAMNNPEATNSSIL